MEAPIPLLSQSRREPVAGPCDVQKPVAVVVPENQGVKVLGVGRIPTDHEFLPLIDPHLAPRTGALTRFVGAVQALCYQSFEPISPDCLNQIRDGGIQLLRLTDRFAELRKNVAP